MSKKLKTRKPKTRKLGQGAVAEIQMGIHECTACGKDYIITIHLWYGYHDLSLCFPCWKKIGELFESG
jgi:hypothetical protein